MAHQPRAVVDADSLLSYLTPEETQAWDELDHDRAQALLQWVLASKFQRTRRERVADLRQMLRLRVADVDVPNDSRWWDTLLDPVAWLFYK